MNITEITTLAGAHRKRRRVGRGRGSGSGKTCGRGHKGAGSRAGSVASSMSEGGQMPMFRRIPKRGFNNAQFARRFVVVNVSDLEQRFKAGDHVTPQSLVEAGLIRNARLPVKVLGNGSLSKKLVVDVAKYSQSAIEKINTAGGQAKSAE